MSDALQPINDWMLQIGHGNWNIAIDNIWYRFQLLQSTRFGKKGRQRCVEITTDYQTGSEPHSVYPLYCAIFRKCWCRRFNERSEQYVERRKCIVGKAHFRFRI